MAVNGIGQAHSTQTEHANTQSPSRANNGGAKATAPNGTVKQVEEHQTQAAPTQPAAAEENNSGRERAGSNRRRETPRAMAPELTCMPRPV
jgi:hypothetical protein